MDSENKLGTQRCPVLQSLRLIREVKIFHGYFYQAAELVLTPELPVTTFRTTFAAHAGVL